MTDFLPLFPLKMVVFPGERLNLHIFEPRYKQLIRECEQNGTTFGIPTYMNEKVMDFGTEIKLLSIEKRYDNGELDIKTQGQGVFRISEFYSIAPNKLYAGADIERLEDHKNGESQLYDEIFYKLKELFSILKITKGLPVDAMDFDTFSVAHQVGFSLEQEYELLCISSEKQRQHYMLSHLKKLIPVVKEMERLRQKSMMNGHFKNIIPPI